MQKKLYFNLAQHCMKRRFTDEKEKYNGRHYNCIMMTNV